MIQPYADNVVIELEPLPTQTASGLAIIDTSRKTRGHRTAKVLASGPGYFSALNGKLIPNETRAGDRVVVEALAGEDWSLNFSSPRHNKSPEFQELFGRGGEFRIVREQEILGVLEEDPTVFLVPWRPPGVEGAPFVRDFESREEAEQFAKEVSSFVSEAERLPGVIKEAAE